MSKNPTRRSPLILVVDDDTTTSRMITGILNQAGFQTACAYDVAGVWTQIHESPPDLVLLDVNLPDGSGFDVCRRLQRESETVRTPVLFISANEDIVSKVKGFEAGGVDYIPKPLAGEEVIARVSTHLRLKLAYESLAELQAEHIQRLASAQETLMPQPADLPDARFFVSFNQVLNAGGDFYDVVPVGGEVVDYIVADASGHDLAAAFWTASLKTLLGEYATPMNTPRDALRSINSAMCRILPPGVFFTILYARFNRQLGRLTLANAGHPPAIIVRKHEGPPTIIPQEGDVVGSFPDASFDLLELKLKRGDRFFLFSDGLIELGGNREQGLERLRVACGGKPEQTLEDNVRAAFQESIAGATPQDDMLLMGVEA